MPGDEEAQVESQAPRDPVTLKDRETKPTSGRGGTKGPKDQGDAGVSEDPGAA